MIPLTPHKVSVGNKLARGIWGVTQALLLRCSPRPAHVWRRFWLNQFGARIAPGCLVYNSAKIWAPWNLEMAHGAVIGDGAEIYNVARVRLGRGAVISQHAFICTASHDFAHDDFALTVGQVSIDEGAWVAAEAFVGPGVVVGAFAILGARAVAIRDVPAGQIWAGNPAKPIGQRPSVTTRPGDVLSGLVNFPKRINQ